MSYMPNLVQEQQRHPRNTCPGNKKMNRRFLRAGFDAELECTNSIGEIVDRLPYTSMAAFFMIGEFARRLEAYDKYLETALRRKLKIRIIGTRHREELAVWTKSFSYLDSPATEWVADPRIVAILDTLRPDVAANVSYILTSYIMAHLFPEGD